jgi:hypothetical protein
MTNSAERQAPDPTTNPAAYIEHWADIREQRAKASQPGPYRVLPETSFGARGTGPLQMLLTPRGRRVAGVVWPATAEHIAAEANPAHALAEVALWRQVARFHQQGVDHTGDNWCGWDTEDWPCLGMRAVVAAVTAYAQDPS